MRLIGTQDCTGNFIIFYTAVLQPFLPTFDQTWDGYKLCLSASVRLSRSAIMSVYFSIIPN